jgi:5'(3')-deoxyribonucleotidase
MINRESGDRKILYIDMDGVIVDFDSGVDKLPESQKNEYIGRYDEVPGIFSIMEPIPGAVDAVVKLNGHFDLYLLSTAPWNNSSAWSDKLIWVKKHFGDNADSFIHKKLILSSNKHLNIGDYLIDDRTKNGADRFNGELILFGSEKFPDWDVVLDYLVQD